MLKMFFMLPVSFISFYTKDEPIFPTAKNNRILQKKVSGVDEVVNHGLSNDLNRIQGFFKAISKIQDLSRLYATCSQEILSVQARAKF